MIDREQLVAALQRLDPREREVLHLLLRRRVPEDAMAEVYGLEPAEVARRRTAAIERLSEELGIQRGADLGHMLQALLEPETWENVVLAEPEEAEAGSEPEEGGEDPQAEVTDIDAGDHWAEAGEPRAEPIGAELAALEEEPAAEPVLAAVADRAEPAEAQPSDEPEPATELKSEPQSAEHVLEMLDEQRLSEESESRKRRRFTAALAAVATVLLPAIGIVAASTLGDESQDEGRKAATETRNFFPSAGGPLSQPFASDPEAVSGYAVARVRRVTRLHATPGGKVKLRIRPRTEWGSARVMGVVRQRGEWLAVQVPELENGQVGWLRTRDAELGTVPWSLHADLSDRELIVRKDGRFVRRMTIAIGSPEYPTPPGRFSVTDKLKVGDKGSPYGCCVVALSGHQTRLPPGWPGGDRLAVHATSDLTSIGQPVSLGCLRAATEQARWLLRKIPLGAPIFVRA